jgi:hypothetical protein
LRRLTPEEEVVLRVLGFGDDEIDRILDYLYPALANEIQQPINPNARMKRLYYYRFNVYIREGVGHSHTKHLPPNFSTPNPLIKLLTPHLNPTFLLLPSNKKKGGKKPNQKFNLYIRRV